MVVQAATELGLPAGEDMACLATEKEKSQVPGTGSILLPPPGDSAPTCVKVEVGGLVSFRQRAPSYMQIPQTELPPPRLAESG